MKIKELGEKLKEFDPEMEVMIYTYEDGHNSINSLGITSRQVYVSNSPTASHPRSTDLVRTFVEIK